MKKFLIWAGVVTVLMLLLGGMYTFANAAFPATSYNHTNKSASPCSIDADCGIGTEGKCIATVCHYADIKIENVGQYTEDISKELLTDSVGDQMPGVIEPGEIDTSAELASICSDMTGTGVIVRNINPTLVNITWAPTPIGSLPGAGVTNKIYLVSGAADCSSSGTDLILCRDTGSAYEYIGIVSAGGGGGSGDITAVGDCTTGACFDGTNGTSQVFKGATSGSVQLTAPANASGTLTLPANTGTLCSTGAVCSGYSGSTHYHSDPATMIWENLTDTTDNKPMATFVDATNVVSVGCHCLGVCTNVANILFEDTGSNAITPTVTCTKNAAPVAFQLVSGGGSFVAGEILQWDVDNTGITTGDTYLMVITTN